jgi:hypothetical protein
MLTFAYFKKFDWYTVWWESEQEPEPLQHFHPVPEPHEHDVAPQHWFK